MDFHQPFLGECSVHLPCCSPLCTSYCFPHHAYCFFHCHACCCSLSHTYCFSLSCLVLLCFSRLLLILIAFVVFPFFMLTNSPHHACYYSFFCACYFSSSHLLYIVPLFALATTFFLRVCPFRCYASTYLRRSK